MQSSCWGQSAPNRYALDLPRVPSGLGTYGPSVSRCILERNMHQCGERGYGGGKGYTVTTPATALDAVLVFARDYWWMTDRDMEAFAAATARWPNCAPMPCWGGWCARVLRGYVLSI